MGQIYSTSMIYIYYDCHGLVGPDGKFWLLRRIYMPNKQQESKVKQPPAHHSDSVKSTLPALVKPNTGAKAYLAVLIGISSYHIPGYN